MSGTPGWVSKTPRAAALALSLATLAFGGTAFTDEFRFEYDAGDKYRYLSTVDEEVYYDRRFSHTVEILNRIAFEVTEEREDGAGYLVGEFMTSMVAEGGYSMVTDKAYHSEYWHLADGRYDIAPRYFMPVVRHVPTFPNRDLKPGDTWNAPGEERHDFRDDFGIPDPYVIPIEVRYRYEGPGDYEGTPVRLVRASYTVFYQPPPPRSWTLAYPEQIAGYSEQLLYWDPERGMLAAYEERFKFIFDLSNGLSVEYRGTARSELIEAEVMDRERLEEEVREAVADLPDVTVRSDERGVTISMENIQFEPDSSELLPSELAKLEAIAAILAGIPDRDIMVTGHTALAGTPQGRAALSLERARAVAEALIRLGARLPEQVIVMGRGAEEPVADNATEEGKSRNRRVEITILEN